MADNYRVQSSDPTMYVHKTAPFPLEYTKAPPKVTKEEVQGVDGAFILKNVMTKDECEQYIRATEALGYTEAPISTGLHSAMMMKEVRDNNRVMWQMSAPEMQPIWDRIVSFMPQTFTDARGTWELCTDLGLNERFRFYRYDAGQAFASHYDGCFPRSRSEMSHLTFIIYLNDGFKGGETGFYPNPHKSETIKVNPQQGAALLFWHSGSKSPLHEGAPHYTQGMRKYALRSDIMYRLKK